MFSRFRAWYDSLPRAIRVAVWVAIAGAVTAIGSAITNGQIPVNPATVGIVNVVLVAIKDFANKRAEADSK